MIQVTQRTRDPLNDTGYTISCTLQCDPFRNKTVKFKLRNTSTAMDTPQKRRP